ncbi:MAG TPA: Spy/CpxP family protein refolding chaperone [Pyrinomonadaceae bacterium]|nr:Spy/CpxP family protein refolding chaperone [Pyrinomonadaceae bacterium]
MKANWKSMSGFAAIAAAFVLALAVAAFSQQGPGGGGPRHGGPGGPPPGDGFRGGPGPRGGGLGPFGRDLNLTDEQKAQIKKITDSFEESTKALHEQLRALHESQPDPMKGGAFDEAAVRSAAQARANIQIELEVAHARIMSQIYNVLTAEQKAQLAAKRQEFEQRRKEREAQRGDDTNN